MKNIMKIYGYIPIYDKMPCFAQIIFQKDRQLYIVDGNKSKYELLQVKFSPSESSQIIQETKLIQYKQSDILKQKLYAYYVNSRNIIVGYYSEMSKQICERIIELIKHQASILTIVSFIGEEKASQAILNSFNIHEHLNLISIKSRGTHKNTWHVPIKSNLKEDKKNLSNTPHPNGITKSCLKRIRVAACKARPKPTKKASKIIK